MRRKSWNDAQLKQAVRESRSIRAVLKCLSLIPAGGNYVQIQKRIRDLKISTQHFTGKGWLKGIKRPHTNERPLKELLRKNVDFQSFKLKRRLYKANLKEKCCEECGWAKTSDDGRIPLELDHINGDSRDNRLSNLRVLCPNCHSLKPTHRGKNKKPARVA